MEPRVINGIRVGDYVPFPEFTLTGGPALVVGHAPGFEDEYNDARTIYPHAPVYAVNRAALKIKADYWVSVHPQEMFKTDTDTIRISDRNFDCVDMAFPIATRGGSSALLATLIALVMGHNKVITAGVHLTGMYKTFQGRWKWYAQQLNGRVCSVSPEGTFIRDYFGGING